MVSQLSRIHLARGLSVSSAWRAIRVWMRSISCGIDDGVQVHAGAITTHAHEFARFIQNVGNAAGHARGKIAAGLAQHHHRSLGHILAAMVAHRFHHGRGAGVPHRKAFTGHPVEEGLAAGGAVENHVAHQDVFFGLKRGIPRRVDDEPAAGKPLAHVIVGLAFQSQGDASGQEGAEALPRRARKLESDGVIGQARFPVAAGNLAAQHRSYRTVSVADGKTDGNFVATFQCLVRVLNELAIERLLEAVVLLDGAVAPHAGRNVRIVKHGGNRSRAPSNGPRRGVA